MNTNWPAFLGMIIALVLYEVGIFHLKILGSDRGNGGWQPEAAAHQQTTNNDIICPSALRLFDNATELEVAIANNIHFHQRGGNLGSIERYLNRHMQNTLDKLDIQFKPNGAQIPTKNAINYLQEFYEKNTVDRGGYGQPLPGTLSSTNGQKTIRQALFEKRWINVLEPPTLERFAAGIGPVGPDCTNKVSFSKGTYEEKNLCNTTKSHEEQQQKQKEEECNIISIGSNDQWGFETEILRKLPGCITHTFDCTLKDNTPQNKPKSNDIKFLPYCIGSNDAQPPYLPYEKLWDTTKARTPPKLLKMDIEGFEYDVLDSVLSSDQSIWPEQIMMEVHWATRMVDVPWMPRTRTAAEMALFFGALFNHGGYIISHTYADPGCQPCMEVLLVRAMC